MDEEDRLPANLDAHLIKKHFDLSDEDLNEVRRCRGAINRIGYAVQFCVLRWRGHFLKDMRHVPWEVLEHIAQQLGLLAIALTDYLNRAQGMLRTRQNGLDVLTFHNVKDAKLRQLVREGDIIGYLSSLDCPMQTSVEADKGIEAH